MQGVSERAQPALAWSATTWPTMAHGVFCTCRVMKASDYRLHDTELVSAIQAGPEHGSSSHSAASHAPVQRNGRRPHKVAGGAQHLQGIPLVMPLRGHVPRQLVYPVGDVLIVLRTPLSRPADLKPKGAAWPLKLRMVHPKHAQHGSSTLNLSQKPTCMPPPDGSSSATVQLVLVRSCRLPLRACPGCPTSTQGLCVSSQNMVSAPMRRPAVQQKRREQPRASMCAQAPSRQARHVPHLPVHGCGLHEGAIQAPAQDVAKLVPRRLGNCTTNRDGRPLASAARER